MQQNLACVFPGQGSQSVAMLDTLSKRYPEILDTFEEASKVLEYDLWSLISEGPQDKLNQTEFTQPAMLVSGVAVYRLWLSLGGVKPSLMAGHSLGEYTALVNSGALRLSDAARLVSQRGRLMQQGVPLGHGAMAAIVGLSDEQVQELCHQSAQGEVLAPANYNAIGQVVIAGETQAVQRAVDEAQNQGARMAMLIPVSVPCHCDLLAKASEQFVHFLNDTEFKTPEIPVIANVDVSIHQNPDAIRASLHKQLYNPVQWVKTVQYMKQQGIDTVLEMGPGKVLSGLIKRTERSLRVYPINDETSLEKAWSVCEALA